MALDVCQITHWDPLGNTPVILSTCTGEVEYGITAFDFDGQSDMMHPNEQSAQPQTICGAGETGAVILDTEGATALVDGTLGKDNVCKC